MRNYRSGKYMCTQGGIHMNLKKAISVVMIGTMVGTLAAGMATTTTYAADTIKIGWLAPLTGTAAENGQQVTWAAEMIVDLINEEHGDINMLLAADAGRVEHNLAHNILPAAKSHSGICTPVFQY